MKVESSRVLDQLPAEVPCFGAVFTGYAFDPAFFEEQVLRAVLRLASDPVEHAERFHDEARRSLQETPVAVIVDAGERQPGRRLPYDVLEVDRTVFHPKAVLLVFEEFARLQIGSGNLTHAGYGGNTELFLKLDLRYDRPADAALLAAFDGFLGRIVQLVRTPGTQLRLVREALQRRLGGAAATAADVPATYALCDSTQSALIEQVIALLPEGGVIQRIGMLAPFYERDDKADLSDGSVFGALLERTGKDASLDVGVLWENPEVQPARVEPELGLQDGLGRLWGWTWVDDEDRKAVEYLVPTLVGRSRLSYVDARGKGSRWPLDEAEEALADGELWMLASPVVYAPRRALGRAREHFGEVRLWLHPTTQLVEGRALHRPLHAKLLLVSYAVGRRTETLVLVGSANMSRAALLRGVREGGNVELGLAFRLRGEWTLPDLVSGLVLAPEQGTDLRERTYPESEVNYGLAIASAVHDPGEGTLVVEWDPDGPELPEWRLSYDGGELAQGTGRQVGSLRVEAFVLRPATAEVILHVGEREFAVPILVTDLVALPAGVDVMRLGLEELLMLLGRRIGAERAVDLSRKRMVATEEAQTELEAMLGPGFTPTDVFRAWWAIADELGDSLLSLAGFRLRLEGSMGAAAVWKLLREATDSEGQLSKEEAWLYGAELVRTLEAVAIPGGAEQEAKAEVLRGLVSGVRRDLRALLAHDGAPAWVERVRAFYGDAAE